MKHIIGLLALLLPLLSTAQSPSVNHQNKTVSGRVNSEINNDPLAGVTVKLKSGKAAAFTNVKGEYKISYNALEDTLQFSYVGYKTFEATVDKIPFVVALKVLVKSLDETIIVAYGNTTRRYNTGNITKITSEDISSQPVSNVLAALEGRVPGMVISQTSGVPGSSFNVQIRGQSALDLAYSKNDPLFIIDGVPFEQGNAPTNQINSAANNPTSISSGGLSPLNAISPSEIESVEVLKDADATSIYGSRGANGVIIITTKKGKKGETKFSINANAGFSKIGRSLNMLNTQQYVQMRREAFANDGYTVSSNSSDPGYAPDITLWDTTRYTDFKKLLIGNTAQTNDVQASVSGGNASTQFFIGGGYHKETTVYPGNFSDGIASSHFNINHSSANKKFNIFLSGMYSSDKNIMPGTDLTRYINLPPNFKLYDSTGKLSWQDNGIVYSTIGNGDIINPLSLLEEQYSSLNENLLANMQLSYKLFNGLVLKTSLGYNTFRSDETTTRPTAAIDPNSGELPSSAFANSNTRNWIIEPQLEYTRTTVNDRLNILLGNTFQDKTGKTSSVYGNNYSSDLLLNSIAAAGNITASNNFVQYRYVAFFGRVNYNLHDKYIVNLSARRDGSSRFAPDKQWANFGAIGMAWLFSEEPFVKRNLSFLSFGKLRGSYGLTGNDQIGDYKFLNLWSNTNNTYNGLSGLYPRSLYNPDYNWEINKKFEAAVELGFLNDAILLSASYYNNRCNNQLINYSLPNQTGFFNVVKNFPGLVSNTGIELVITTRNIHSKELNWTISFNITIPRNKLLAFPGLSSSSYASRYVVGKPLSVIRAFKYTGVDPQTGLYTFEDMNHDGVIYDGDYQYFGNTDPKFYGGIQNNISFRQFDLGFFFEFRKQTGLSYLRQLYNTPPGWIYNQPEIVMNRWQKPGDVTNIQEFTSGYSNAYTAISALSLSNANYTDASFIRLKNISLSYRLPVPWLQRYHISNCRFYIEAQNLFIISNYIGADPESQNFYVLPPLRSIVWGIQ
ncbi:MAG TPA: SusC/RagA family TonB-linked outer membrane protein, partial [Hanamia sp.]